MQKAIKNILLDRDGTIIEDRGYIHKPEQVCLYPATGPCLKQMVQLGYKLFLVTNQSGLGRGYFELKDYKRVQKKLADLLAQFNVYWQAEVFCPHAPESKCSCRKPSTGMWEYLVQSLELKPEQSVMIGDKLSDIQFAYNAGLYSSILVLTGSGETELRKIGLNISQLSYTILNRQQYPQGPHVIAQDLQAACDWIKLETG